MSAMRSAAAAGYELSSVEVAQAANLATRDLEWWLRSNAIPGRWVWQSTPSSGHYRRWKAEAVTPIAVAARCSRALVGEPGVRLPARVVRQIIETAAIGDDVCYVGDGVAIWWDYDPRSEAPAPDDRSAT